MERKKFCVVIPIYKESLDCTEIIALKRYWEIANNKYDIYFVRPNKEFNMQAYYDLIPGWEGHVFEKTFDEDYFLSTATYSQLCINIDFYTAFIEYEYMYIYQLDCYLFRDEMEYWCNKGYDYIGGPIISTDCGWDTVKKHNNKDTYSPYVGNGGFSLRKIDTFIDICDPNGEFRTAYKLTDEKLSSIKWEDKYFCNDIYDLYQMNIPDWKEAINFAWDMSADVIYGFLKITNFPMAIHSVDKNIRFWKKHLEEFNTEEIINYCEEKHKEFFKIYYDENDSSLREG